MVFLFTSFDFFPVIFQKNCQEKMRMLFKLYFTLPVYLFFNLIKFIFQLMKKKK